MNKNLPKSWEKFTNYNQNELGFLTVIVSLIPVKYNFKLSDIKKQILNDINSFKNTFSNIPRKQLKGLRWIGYFEIDLINPKYNFGKSHQWLLNDMNVDHANAFRIINVHFHGLIYHPDQLELRDVINEKWSERKRTLLKSLYSNNSIDKNVNQIYNYSSKRKLIYTVKGGFDDEQSVFKFSYEHGWKELTKGLYNYINDNIGLEYKSR